MLQLGVYVFGIQKDDGMTRYVIIESKLSFYGGLLS